jgi:hypothetical protein
MAKRLLQETDKVQEENLMLSNNTVSVCGGVASVIDE